MGLMHLWSEVRLCRVIHYIGQREVLLYTWSFVVQRTVAQGHSQSRKEDTHYGAMRYSRQRRDKTTHDRGQSVACKVNSLDAEQEYRLTIYSLYTGQKRGGAAGLLRTKEKQYSRAARLRRAEERQYSKSTRCSGQREGGTTELLALLRTAKKQYTPGSPIK
jgi:hypothetical protein